MGLTLSSSQFQMILAKADENPFYVGFTDGSELRRWIAWQNKRQTFSDWLQRKDRRVVALRWNVHCLALAKPKRQYDLTSKLNHSILRVQDCLQSHNLSTQNKVQHCLRITTPTTPKIRRWVWFSSSSNCDQSSQDLHPAPLQSFWPLAEPSICPFSLPGRRGELQQAHDALLPDLRTRLRGQWDAEGVLHEADEDCAMNGCWLCSGAVPHVQQTVQSHQTQHVLE